MEKLLIQENILQVIKEKIPNRTVLVNLLVDLLNIEKEAVYRRIRGEVPFSFAEIALIAKAFDISLDAIISNTLSSKSRPFQLKMINYFDPQEIDYAMMQEYNDILVDALDDPTSELVDCTSIFPLQLLQGCHYLERLQLLKNIYESGQTNAIKKFDEVFFNERMGELSNECSRLTRRIKNAYYIFDPLIFQYWINDIIYFKNIDLLNEEEVRLLKKDLERLIFNLEQAATLGVDKETGSNLHFYIASINFNVNMCTVKLNEYHISLIKAFVFNHFTSLDIESFELVKQRTNSMFRSSTLISVSGERQRKIYFDRQREIINVL
ncbi:transcriptional regulator with XRE-family HTH domain [Parabacteroides sp. PFB2-10]|uniref:helix-turn-helix domain-containing protein n=1 Tax=Parabacteroides sp. PFB2-10 TaxID=1742405 RepID=UPI002473EFF7|nr:helix-turn-helix domain-containing protein [Parabacteroides sp. PFB2-10]MDH6313731.1 transcriptional regulator with XRE-family HTH domain [Parabacteroides sp. PFB2-10]